MVTEVHESNMYREKDITSNQPRSQLLSYIGVSYPKTVFSNIEQMKSSVNNVRQMGL